MDLCGAKKKSGGTCGNTAGKKTDHPGLGRCWLHGGATPIKSGRYSTIKRAQLRQRLDEFLNDPDPLDLLPEVALLRAFLADVIERWDDIYGPDGALLAWHESFLDPEKNPHPKPRQLPDFSSLITVVDKVGVMVDRIQKHQQEGSVSLVTLNRIVEQLGTEAVSALRESTLDEDQITRVLTALERRWGAIRLEPDRPRAQRTAHGTGKDG